MRSSAVLAFDALTCAVLESGRTWDATAEDYQRTNARAILDLDDGVRQTWIELPRGARKTTDLAGILLCILLFQAPEMARIYVGASDEDQAAELIDAAEGLIARTPQYRGLFKVSGLEIEVVASGASVRALAGDLSAMGKRAYLLVLDEVANWPQTKRAKKFWTVLTSGNRKIDECRTVVITNSGEPDTWQWKRREVARTSPHWRFHSTPGPLPWLTPADLESLRENAVTESEFARLHLNRWVVSEDRLAAPADLAACVHHAGPLPAVTGHRYVIALDLGLTNDASVVAVLHREGDATVLDCIRRWRGTRAEPVQLSEVTAAVHELHQQYNRAELIVDPWQAKGMAQDLAARGVTVREFSFSATSVGRVGLALYTAIRDRKLRLPDDEDLLDELGSVRLIKNGAGVYRLDHSSSGHDDQAVTLGLGLVHLLDTSAGPEWVFAPSEPHAGDGFTWAGPGAVIPHRADAWSVAASNSEPREDEREFVPGAVVTVPQ